MWNEQQKFILSIAKAIKTIYNSKNFSLFHLKSIHFNSHFHTNNTICDELWAFVINIIVHLLLCDIDTDMTQDDIESQKI